jgi:circadian clock protein KaiB
VDEVQVFSLFVVAGSAASRHAVANARRLCDEFLPGRYELEVIDLVERPEVASELQIIASPTLIRSSPEPPVRLIGDLSDRVSVVSALGLTE